MGSNGICQCSAAFVSVFIKGPTRLQKSVLSLVRSVPGFVLEDWLLMLPGPCLDVIHGIFRSHGVSQVTQTAFLLWPP